MSSGDQMSPDYDELERLREALERSLKSEVKLVIERDALAAEAAMLREAGRAALPFVDYLACNPHDARWRIYKNLEAALATPSRAAEWLRIRALEAAARADGEDVHGFLMKRGYVMIVELDRLHEAVKLAIVDIEAKLVPSYQGGGLSIEGRNSGLSEAISILRSRVAARRL